MPLYHIQQIPFSHPGSYLTIGNIDNRILVTCDKEAIYKEVERCTQLGRNFPGYFYMVSNHLTHHLTIDSIGHYFKACHNLGKR